MTELPWCKNKNKYLSEAQKILDEDHYGLEKVKNELGFLAVQKFKNERSNFVFSWSSRCGKTSLGKSIAKATNRKFIRISLGKLEMKQKYGGTEELILDLSQEKLSK